MYEVSYFKRYNYKKRSTLRITLESLKALVKRNVNFQKQDLFQFVSDLEECVQEQ